MSREPEERKAELKKGEYVIDEKYLRWGVMTPNQIRALGWGQSNPK